MLNTINIVALLTTTFIKKKVLNLISKVEKISTFNGWTRNWVHSKTKSHPLLSKILVITL